MLFTSENAALQKQLLRETIFFLSPGILQRSSSSFLCLCSKTPGCSWHWARYGPCPVHCGWDSWCDWWAQYWTIKGFLECHLSLAREDEGEWMARSRKCFCWSYAVLVVLWGRPLMTHIPWISSFSGFFFYLHTNLYWVCTTVSYLSHHASLNSGFFHPSLNLWTCVGGGMTNH